MSIQALSPEDKKKSKQELLEELFSLREQLNTLTQAETQRKRGDEAIKAIVTGLSSFQGELFFDSLVTQFAHILEADITFIGEFIQSEKQIVKTLALCIDGKIVDNIQYNLTGTPCENVILKDKSVCTYPAGVAELFPDDLALTQLNIEGYIGIPLLDFHQQPIGIMVALYKSAITDAAFAQSILHIFAARAAAEIERQKTTAAFEQSEERFRQIVEASPMGIHMYRWEGNHRLVFIGANPAADHILGVDNRQFIGKTILEAFPPLKDTEVPQRYCDAATQGIPWHTEQINYQNEQISGAFEVYAFQTHPNVMAAMFLDITKRKQTEEDLRKLRNLLSNIVNSMPSILIAVDAKGHITQWNHEAEKETGIPSLHATGQKLADLFPQLKNQMELVRLAIKNRLPQKDIRIPLKHNENTRIADVTVFPLITNGVEGAVIRVDDISERIQMEEMMIQSEKMLSVGGLAAGMAHEINNPLAGILQNAQVMIQRLSPQFPKNIQTASLCGTTIKAIDEYLQRREIFLMLQSIIESGQRAAKIVSNMLNFSRKSESQFTPGNMMELLDRTIELASNDYDLKKKYDFRCIQIVREYAPDIPAVLCESTKIQQVFLNILKNGAQAMSEKWNQQCPDIQNTILATDIDNNSNNQEKPQFILRIKPEQTAVRIEIEDNGPGIDKAVQKRIFEPFFTTKEPGIGTGLGLSVSYFIITENHKGTLTVESMPGQGAKFIIRLPLKQEPLI